VWRTLRRIEVVSGLPTVDDDAIVAAFLFYFHERYLPNQEKSVEKVSGLGRKRRVISSAAAERSCTRKYAVGISSKLLIQNYITVRSFECYNECGDSHASLQLQVAFCESSQKATEASWLDACVLRTFLGSSDE